MSWLSAAVAVGLIVAGSAFAAGPSAGVAAKKPARADLLVRSAQSKLDGRVMTVTIVAGNAGRRGAGLSTGAVSWTQTGSRSRITLKRFALLAVGVGGRRTVKVTLEVPLAASGSFAVSVCLDVRSKVRESNGTNNCRSAGTLKVPVALAPVTTTTNPIAAPAPAAPLPVAPIGGGPAPGPGTPTPPAADVPDTSINRGPVGVTMNRSEIVLFSASEVGSTLECRLDGGPWYFCTSPSTLSSLADGSHTFEARATDVDGNTDASPASRTWTTDGTPPDTTITAGPSAAVNTTSATFAFTATEAGSTFQCRLDGGAWGYCDASKDLTALTPAAHTFQTRAIDSAGNIDPTPASRTWTVDMTAPQTTLAAGGPSGSLNPPAGAFTFSSSEVGSTFECRLDGGTWAACTSPASYTGLADGSRTFEVRAIDPAGNVDATPASRTWTVDAVAPDTTLGSGPSGTVATASASFGFSSEAGATFECRLDGGAWAACTSPANYASLVDGSHTFDVRAIDVVGNVDATPASRTWTVDTTAPDTSITSGPSTTVATASASFGFSSEAGATFECRIDGGAWGACTSTKSYAALAQGSHTFDVRAIDAVGNVDQSPASRTWSVDTVAPETTITGGPSGSVSSTSPSFTFTSSEAGGTFECRIDAGAWGACTSPKTYAGLAQGSHTFDVRAIDAVANVDQTPASRTWTVDTLAPETTITAGPTGSVSSAAPSFSFTSSEAGGTFECRIDAGAWGACTSPKTYAGLAQGSHTFEVRAIDAATNADASPASRTWTVDTVQPDTTITAGPTGSVSSAAPSFSFTSSEAGGTFECRIDAGAWGACTSPKTYAGLAQGSHTFDVRAIDTAGNVDQTPASRTWTVDTVAPETTITGGPTGSSNNVGPSFTFTSSEAGGTFECRIDAGAWGACTSPQAYAGLTNGSHTFDVRAIDAAINTDGSPASRTWTVDTVAPDTTITGGPTGSSNNAGPSFTFTSSEAGGTFECRIDAGTWGACTSPRTYAGLTNASHTFEVRAIDAATNPDASPASRTWTVDTVAPDTTITGGPSGTVNNGSPSFTLTSSEAGSTFECRIDAGTWGACTSPKAYSGLADGSHTFDARAIDAATNVDATPASRTWTVDAAAPDTTLTGGPTGSSNDVGPSFTFTSSEAGSTFECRIDAGVWGACTSPKAYAGLTPGSHTFDVRAIDAATNIDASPASRTWTIDTAAPDTTITGGPSGTVNSASPSFTFTSTEAGSTFECRIDAGTWGACTSPANYSNLAEGSHTFEVRAIDAATNVDPTPASQTWTIDTQAPDTSITSGPTGTVADTNAAFEFSAPVAEAGLTFECRLDGGSWTACTSPASYTTLANGSHLFEVRAKDALGNADATPASQSWTVAV